MSSSENSSSNPFKDRFDNWEGPVRPDFWNDLEKNLDASTKKPSHWWWISGLILLGGISTGIWYNFDSEKTKASDGIQASQFQSEKSTAEKTLPAAPTINPTLTHPESSSRTESAPKQNAQSPESENTLRQEESGQFGTVTETGPSAKHTLPVEKERLTPPSKAFVLESVSGSLEERGTQNWVKTQSKKQALVASENKHAKQQKQDKPKSETILIPAMLVNGEKSEASSPTEEKNPGKRIDPIVEKNGHSVLSSDAAVAETLAANQNVENPLNQFPLKEEQEQMKTASAEQAAAGSGKPNQTDSVQVADQKTMPIQMESPKKSRSADSSQSRKRLSYWAGVSANGVSRQMKLFRRPEEFLGKESRGLKQFRISPVAGLHVTGNLDWLPWLALRLDVTAMAWLETVEYRIEAGQSAERDYNTDQQDSAIMLVQPKISPRNEVKSSWNGLLGIMPELDFHRKKGSYGLRLGNRFQWNLRNTPDSRIQLWTPSLAFYRKNKNWDGEFRMHFYRQEEKSPRILPESRAEIRQILWGFTLRRRL